MKGREDKEKIVIYSMNDVCPQKDVKMSHKEFTSKMSGKKKIFNEIKNKNKKKLKLFIIKQNTIPIQYLDLIV